MCAPQSTAASAVGGGDSCDIFLWIVVNSLDKQMQNEKELIGLASSKGGGVVFYSCGSYYKSEIIAHRMSSGERPWIR